LILNRSIPQRLRNLAIDGVYGACAPPYQSSAFGSNPSHAGIGILITQAGAISSAIESCSLMVAEVRKACIELKGKIAPPTNGKSERGNEV
jgi:hypothetical protein